MQKMLKSWAVATMCESVIKWMQARNRSGDREAALAHAAQGEASSNAAHEEGAAMDFIDGAIVLEENPCATFEAVTQAGYALRYRLDQSTGAFVDLLVQIVQGEAVVGEAEFTDDGSYAHCQNVEVDPRHRRKKLATAMYVFAESLFGRPLSNFWEGLPQSAAATKLWAQSNRPFGHHKR
ncbi:MAG: hypothetical protein U0791_06040 [Gemmataceae bacterium]